ncbi:MAG: nuclear transport factor 2 family protein [Candidatus Thiodiazotropha sp. (ex Notomyrtea botanica)]|nr:nuclear transport factor 2 family protein [Candidatus Thiodiazotropha sp. (ex Notomyrtea botanica)]
MDKSITNREIALEYLRWFCAGDIDRLGQLLTTDLILNGPFHHFFSAEDYLQSLRNTPPEPSNYNLLSITDSDDEVVLFYDYLKPHQRVRIAQCFRFRQQQISEILLIFDTKGIA